VLEIIGPDNITDAILKYARNEVLQLVAQHKTLSKHARDVSEAYKRESKNFKRRVRRYTKKQGIEDVIGDEHVYNLLDFIPGLAFEVMGLDSDKKTRLTEEQRERIRRLEEDYVNRLVLLQENIDTIKEENQRIYFDMLERTIVQKLFGYTPDYPHALLCIKYSENDDVELVEADFVDMTARQRKDIPLTNMPINQYFADKLEDIARLEYMSVYSVQHHVVGFSWEEMAEHVMQRFHARYANDGKRLKKERVKKLLDNAFHATLGDGISTDLAAMGYKKIN
jgi:hypothetical protein